MCTSKGHYENRGQVQPKVEPKQDQQPVKCKAPSYL